MNNSIERLLDAATKHGLESDPDHEVGDLQSFLRLAWEVMTDAQCDYFMGEAEERGLIWGTD